MKDLLQVKAIGDWELDVLGIPFGGPNAGKDAHGEYFSAKTDLELNSVKPLIHYYHGYDETGKPQGKPEKIGMVKGYDVRSDGVWWRVALDKASKFAQRVWDAAKRGIAAASSGTAEHLRRVTKEGEIVYWPVFELSLFDTENGKLPANSYAVALPALKAVYEQAGVSLPDILRETSEAEAEAKGDEHRADAVQSVNGEANNLKTGVPIMDEKEKQVDINQAVTDAVKAAFAEREAAAKAEADRKAEIESAVKAEKEKWEADAAKSQRLPTPTITHLGEIGQYDEIDMAQMDLTAAVMRKNGVQPSENFLKSYAMKAESAAKESAGARRIDAAIKAVGVKANELNYSTYSTYGDQWIGVEYSRQLWESIRQTAGIVNRIPQDVIPDGYESKVWPLESTDPTWYKVAEATAAEDTGYTPATTVTASKLSTANKSITLAKLGARVMYSGEMNERSLVRFAPQLQRQLEASGAEILEHAIIDGDDETDASTNINDIAGTPAGTEAFMVWDGFRYLALATSGQNRSASGGLTADDYLNTLKLLGTAGINALDPSKVAFIVDPNTYWASLKLDEVKTRDVFGPATLEAGMLTRMWGREVLASSQMHRMDSDRLANSAGKVDQDTVANNAYGAILAVRFDQWKFAYQRRMTMETTRYARADAWEIVALMTCGLAYRDTSASAITYYVGV